MISSWGATSSAAMRESAGLRNSRLSTYLSALINLAETVQMAARSRRLSGLVLSALTE